MKSCDQVDNHKTFKILITGTHFKVIAAVPNSDNTQLKNSKLKSSPISITYVVVPAVLPNVKRETLNK